MGVFYEGEQREEDSDERVLECISMMKYTKQSNRVSLCLVAMAKAKKVLSTFYLASF